MAGWKYRLESGKALRQAIDMEDYEKVVEGLRCLYREIHKVVPEMYDEDDLQNTMDDLDMLEGTVYGYQEEDVDEDELVEEIDYALGEVYDLCDTYRLWVEV